MTAPMNLGTLVGYLTLDDKGVDVGVRGATAKIQGFAKTGAAEGGKAGTAIGKSAGDKTVQEYGKAEGKLVDKTRTMFSSVGKMATGILGGIGVASILTKGWDRLTGIENAQAKLRGLGHDGEAVQQIMDNALASVKGTAFGLAEAATTAAGAVAAGIQPGEDLERVLKATANSAAAAGVGMDEMGGIFNKVASLGKAQNDVLQQVANQGLPIYQKLAEQFGVTADEVFKMATRSEIGFADFEAAMKAASGTVADEMGQTTTGAISNLGAAMSRLGADLLQDVMPAIKGTAEAGIFLADAWGKVPGPVKAAALAMVGYAAVSRLGGFAKLSEWMLLLRVRASELSKVSGPHGLGASLGKLAAATGVGAGIAALSSSLADAKRNAEQFDSAVGGLTQSLIESGGVWDAEIKRRREMEVIDSKLFKTLVANGANYGEALNALVNGYAGADEASQSFRDAVQALNPSLADELTLTLRVRQAAQEAADAHLSYARAAGELTGGVDEAREQFAKYGFVVNDAARSTEGYADAAGNATEATGDVTARLGSQALAAHYAGKAMAEWDTETRKAEEAASAADRAIRSLARALADLRGDEVDARVANERMNDAIRNATEAAEKHADSVKKAKADVAEYGRGSEKAADAVALLDEKVLDADGNLNTRFSPTAAKIRDDVQNIADALDDQIEAIVVANGKTGDYSTAMSESAARVEDAEKAARKLMKQYPLTGKEAKILAEDLIGLDAQQVANKVFDVIAEDFATPVINGVQLTLDQLKDKHIRVYAQSVMSGDSQAANVAATQLTRASGGAITGPGTGTSDSILARLSNGEHVWTAREVDKLGGQQAMYNLRAAVMAAPGFASGGSLTPPTAQALSGIAAPSLGPTLGGVTSALGQFAAMIGAVRDAATDAAAKSKDADKALRQVTTATSRDAKDRERTYARAKRDEDESLKGARERLAEVKKEAAGKKDAAKQVEAAEAALDKARRKRNERLGDLERTMNRANKADERKLRQAEKAALLAEKEAAASKQRADAIASLHKNTETLRLEQLNLAGQLDDTNQQLGEARTALQNLQQASASLRDSISSGMLSGSALGTFSPGSTIENIAEGMRNRLQTSQGIQSALSSLAGRGLNSSLLEQIGQMGLGGAQMAATLAGASNAQIQELNSLQAQLKRAADATGTVVADAIYANDIRLANQNAQFLEQQQAQLEQSLQGIAGQLETAITAALQGLDITTGDKEIVSTLDKRLSAVASAVASVQTAVKQQPDRVAALGRKK